MKDPGNCLFGPHLLRSKAGVFQFSPVRKKWTPVCVENKDLLRNYIDELSKLRFALPNLFFRPLSVRYIADAAGNQHALRGFQRAEANLHRKLPPILMQPVQLQSGAHRPRARVGNKSRAVFRMLAPEPLRYQHFDYVPQYLSSRIAK